MARDEEIERRLRVWARWLLTRGGSGVMGYAKVDLAEIVVGGGGYATASVPLLAAEAAETDEAVQLLYPGGLKLTVLEYYAGRGGIAEKAARLCCSEATIHHRLGQVHRQLAEHFAAREQKRRQERERVEQLQRAASSRNRSFTP